MTMLSNLNDRQLDKGQNPSAGGGQRCVGQIRRPIIHDDADLGFLHGHSVNQSAAATVLEEG